MDLLKIFFKDFLVKSRGFYFNIFYSKNRGYLINIFQGFSGLPGLKSWIFSMWTNGLMCIKTLGRYSIRKEILMVFYVQMIGRRSVMCKSYVGGIKRSKV